MNKSKLLACVSVAALLAAHQAHAQDQGAQQAAAETMGEIVVKGRPLAESTAAALEIQRSSDSLVSVLSADAVGNLPDQNIAYAVGRLPGVAVERDQGQARYINLRGAPVYWTTLSFDGLSVVSPQGRDSRFDNIPSAIASQITVQKAIVPSMAGASVAGNVDIRTRRAFDYDGRTLTGKVGYGYVKLGGGKELDTALVYSDIFAGDKLGVVAQGSFYSREMATDNWETDPYLSNTVNPEKHFAREHENKHYRLTRENISGSTRIDYRVDNHEVFASTVYTLYHDDELRDNFIFRLDQGTDAAGNSYTSAGYINATNPKNGTTYGARINARIDHRDSKEKMSTSTLGGEHVFGDLEASWRANYTFTLDGRDTPVTAAFQSPGAFNLRPTIDYVLSNGNVNTVALYSTGGVTGARVKGPQVTNIENFQFPLQSIGRIFGGDITQASTLKLDLDYHSELFGMATKFEFGGLYTDREKKSRERNYLQTFTTGTIPTWAIFAKDNLGYLGTQHLNYTFRYTDQDLTAKYVDNLIAVGTATLQNSSANYWRVGETISAGYVMGTTDLGWGNVVYGVRVENIKNNGEAIVAFPASPGVAAGARLVNVSSADTAFYPSAHLNWNLDKDIKVRVGVTTSASRPDFDDLRPNFTISDATQSISGGNPSARPEKQIGFDAYLEWYLSQTGFLSAGVFYKDISNVLVQTSGVFGLDTLDVAGLDRSGYAYTSIGNGGSGHLEGVELAFVDTAEVLAQRMGLPGWMEGFGVNASVTLTSSGVDLPAVGGVPVRRINVLGTSDVVYNLQATYERYGLSLRLAYQYRSPWGQSVGAYRVIGGNVYPVDDGDIFWDADEEVDLSIRYQVTPEIETFFDAVNLTNLAARRYGDQKQYPIEYEKFGRRFIGGVRFHL